MVKYFANSIIKTEIALLTGMILLSDPKHIYSKGKFYHQQVEYFISETQKINENPDSLYESIIAIKYRVSLQY
jgi:hypothetical protein